jgi:glutaconate CoA-transferase subunit A
MDYYATLIKKDPEAGIAEYMGKYIYGPESWVDYLDLIGMEELLDATRRGRSIYDD